MNVPVTGTPPQRQILHEAKERYTAVRVEQDTYGTVYTDRAASNGVYSRLAQNGDRASFSIRLPQGPLLPSNMDITGTVAGKDQPARIEAQMGSARYTGSFLPDGKIAISLAPNGPMAVIDTNTLEYGMATSPVSTAQLPTGESTSVYQALQEIIKVDGSRTILAHMTNAVVADQNGQAALQTTLMQIDDGPHGTTGKEVRVFSPAPQPGTQPQPQVQERPFQVVRQKDGAFATSVQGVDGQPLGVRPFSAYGAAALFAAIQAAGAPAAAAAMVQR